MYMFIQYIEVVHVGHHHPLHFQDNIDVDIVDTVFQWKLAPLPPLEKARKGEKWRKKGRPFLQKGGERAVKRLKKGDLFARQSDTDQPNIRPTTK
jgi:hypothetical protein